MSAHTTPAQEPPPAAESHVRALYQAMLQSWNRRDAGAMAALFAQNARSGMRLLPPSRPAG